MHGTAPSTDHQATRDPPHGVRECLDEAEQILVRHHVAHEERVRRPVVRRRRGGQEARRTRRDEARGVVPEQDHVKLVGGQAVEVDEVATRALRADDHRARMTKHRGHVVAEVVLLARIFFRRLQRQQSWLPALLHRRAQSPSH